MFELFVEGKPVPQGSMTAFPMKGRCVVTAANNKTLKPWRAAITQAVVDAMDERRDDPFMHGLADKDTPIAARLRFYLPRPTTVKREYPTVKPDLDKLTRAVLDAVTDAGLLADDANVVDLHSTKRYATGFLRAGVDLSVWDAS